MTTTTTTEPIPHATYLNLPIELKIDGAVYKLSRILTYEMEVAFADWVQRSALNRIERLRALGNRPGSNQGITEDQYERMLDRHCNALAAGRFEWGGDLVRAAGNTQLGSKYAIWLRLLKYQPTVTMALVEKLWQDEDAMRELMFALNPTIADDDQPKKESEASQSAK